MREQLDWLKKLQLHDAAVQEMLSTLSLLPKQLENAKRALLEMQRRLSSDREAFAENEVFHSAQEAEQKKLAQQITKSKSKLSQVRNLKESNATQRELENTRRMMEMREQDLKHLFQTLLDQKNRITEQENKLKSYSEDLQEQEVAGQNRLEELRGQADKTRVEREALLAHIEPAVLSMYESLRKRQRWPILVSAEKGICSGCHMHISPQIYNQLYKGLTIETCAHCHRILYLP